MPPFQCYRGHRTCDIAELDRKSLDATSPAGMVLMELLSAKCPLCSRSSRNWIKRVVTVALGIASPSV
jgi:hypothetical protein